MNRVATYLFLGILLTLPSFHAAAERRWVQIGPPGGHIYNLTPDRKHPSVWFVEADGLYRSDNYGKSWKLIQSNARQLTIHTTNHSQYFRSGYPEFALYKSINDGQNFQIAGKLFPNYDYFRLDHFASGLVYMWRDTTIVWSQDDGKNWVENPVQFQLPKNLYGCSSQNFYVADLLPSPVASGELFATVEFQCDNNALTLFLESKDRGGTWKVIFSRRSNGYSFHYDPDFPSRAFAFNNKSIEIFSGSTWTQWAMLACVCSTLDFLSVPNNPNQFYLVQQIYRPFFKRKLLFTSNSGKTWVEDETPVEDYPFFRTMQVPATGLMAGTERSGIFRRDSNKKWKAASNGLQSRNLYFYVNVSGNSIYAFGSSDTLGRSDDGGRTWIDVFQNLPRGNILTVKPDPKNPQVAIIATELNLEIRFHRTTDGGRSWKHLFSTSIRPYPRAGIFYDPFHPSNVYFITPGNRVWKSIKSGYKPFPLEVLAEDLALDRSYPDAIYFLYNGQVYRSTDGGVNVLRTALIRSAYDDEGTVPVFITQKGNRIGSFLLADEWEDLLHTDTGGRSWKRLSSVPAGISGGGDPPGARRVVSADAQGNHFFVPTKVGFFESTDGGKHWKNIKREFPRQDGEIYFGNASDPRSGILVVTAEHHGMFKLSGRSATPQVISFFSKHFEDTE